MIIRLELAQTHTQTPTPLTPYIVRRRTSYCLWGKPGAFVFRLKNLAQTLSRRLLCQHYLIRLLLRMFNDGRHYTPPPTTPSTIYTTRTKYRPILMETQHMPWVKLLCTAETYCANNLKDHCPHSYILCECGTGFIDISCMALTLHWITCQMAYMRAPQFSLSEGV